MLRLTVERAHSNTVEPRRGHVGHVVATLVSMLRQRSNRTVLAGQEETDWKGVLKRGGALVAHEEEAVIKGLAGDANSQQRFIVVVLVLLNVVIFALFSYMYVIGEHVPLMALTSIGVAKNAPVWLDPERPSPEVAHTYLAVLTSSSLSVVYLLLLRNGISRVSRCVRLGAKGAIVLAIALPQVSAAAAFATGEGFPLLPLLGTFTAGAAMYAIQSQGDMQRMIGELNGLRTHRQGA